MLIYNTKKDLLKIKAYSTRREMGKAAGGDAAEALRQLLEKKETVNMIFAAAPSQNETLETLCSHTELEWNRVNAFHMDEYVGISGNEPQSFGYYLKEHVFSKLPFRSVNFINGAAPDKTAECERYQALLLEFPVDIVCLGIGENGHIAFNDPHVADFNDKTLIKPVTLDEKCRNQQVNDGCFPSLDKVPEIALTLTVPALFSAEYLFCSVPAITKAEAVKNTAENEINEKCPATIMRRHKSAIMYCDRDSISLLLNK